MSHKKLALWSVVMIVIFGVTVMVYPLVFNPQNGGMSEVEPTTAPITAPVAPN